MKTLDEIIAELSNLMPVDDCNCSYIMDSDVEDALHYLKEYRDECNHIYDVESDYLALRDEWQQRFNEQLEHLRLNNPPLRWSQLEKMVGKPVWIEDENDRKWEIIERFYQSTDEPHLECFFTKSNLCYGKRQLGHTWLAYSKEVKDENFRRSN